MQRYAILRKVFEAKYSQAATILELATTYHIVRVKLRYQLDRMQKCKSSR